MIISETTTARHSSIEKLVLAAAVCDLRMPKSIRQQDIGALKLPVVDPAI
jgi:hypothetical protein